MAGLADLLFVLLVFAAGVLCGAGAMVARYRAWMRDVLARLDNLEHPGGIPTWRHLP